MKGVTTTQAEPAIRLRALRKEFGHVMAVNGIDLDVPAGAVYGYLGPNGAEEDHVAADDALGPLWSAAEQLGDVVGAPVEPRTFRSTEVSGR